MRPGAWLAILVSAGAVAVTWKLEALNVPWLTRQPEPTRADASPPQTIIHQPSTEVQLSDDPALRTRATTPGTWSITDPRFGTIRIPVAVGEVPLREIAHELTRRGYQVILPASRP